MSTQKLISEKSSIKNEIKKSLSITSKNRAIGWICPDIEITKDFLQWLSLCDADFVVSKENSEIQKSGNFFVSSEVDVLSQKEGFDFFLCGGKSKNIQDFMAGGVVPILHKDNYLSALLKDFNPIKGEWNAFFYSSQNKWSMYAALVKYFENYKFPYDNKNLVKNIFEM